VSLHWAWAVQQFAAAVAAVKVTPSLSGSMYWLLPQTTVPLGAPQQTVSLHLQHQALVHVAPEQDMVLALAYNSWVAGQV
jgi:hypothetical protein